MQVIVVASKNPVKIQASLLGFQSMFPEAKFSVKGISVSSDVSDQPTTDDETYTGALNRADNAFISEPDADFWVGLEGGVELKDKEMRSFAWIVVRSKNAQIGKARTSTFILPPKVADLIQQGKELGEADDIVFGMTNSKQKSGAIGILTHNVIDRKGLYKDAVIAALIPHKNSRLYG